MPRREWVMGQFNEVREAQIVRVLRALRREGVLIRGARIYGDGSVELVSCWDGSAADVPADWVELAGEHVSTERPTRH